MTRRGHDLPDRSATLRIRLVAVVGSGRASAELEEHAHQIGRAIAESGAGLVCGGKAGIFDFERRFTLRQMVFDGKLEL